MATIEELERRVAAIEQHLKSGAPLELAEVKPAKVKPEQAKEKK